MILSCHEFGRRSGHPLAIAAAPTVTVRMARRVIATSEDHAEMRRGERATTTDPWTDMSKGDTHD